MQKTVELENLLMCSEASEGRVLDQSAYESLTIMQKVDIFDVLGFEF